jgi:hypothetical protein
MANEYANPMTGQPYDKLTEQEYAAIRRNRPLALPCNCRGCGKRVDDGWWMWHDGTLALHCYECRFASKGGG